MRRAVAFVVLVAVFAGCSHDGDDPTVAAAAPGAALSDETPWWMPCDWSDSVPSPARGAWTDRHPLNIAHQGGENEVPSATMYAFKTALRKGADMLELDVHITADGELVVLHDTTVDRTTEGTGAVQDLTLAAIEKLDAAYWFVPGRNAVHDAAAGDYALRGIRTGEKAPPPGCTPDDFRIPTLREVLTEFPGVMMNIEIKNGLPQGRPYESELAALLAEFHRADDTIIASFIDIWTETLRLYNMDVSTSTGTVETGVFKGTSLAVAPGAPTLLHEAFQVPIEFEGVQVVDADFVADAHRNGMAVHVWTIDDAATMNMLLDIGVDGIMTAEPTVLERVLTERGTKWV